MPARRLLPFLIALLLPAQASAAVIVGSAHPVWTGETLECVDPDGCTFVPRTIAGRVIAVPADGVVVAWSARLPSSAVTTPIALRALRPTASGAVPLSSTPASPPASPGALTFVTNERVPVRAGDLIGVRLDDGDEIGVVSHSAFDSSSWSFFGPFTGDRSPDSIDSDDPTEVYADGAAVPAGTRLTVVVATGRPCE